MQRNFTTEAHLKSVPNDLAMQLILPPGSYQNVLEHEARFGNGFLVQAS